MPWIAKVINDITHKEISFENNQVYMDGWNYSSSYNTPKTEIPGMDGVYLDDEYRTKKPLVLSLNIKITCPSADEARELFDRITNIFADRIKIYLYDDRYTYGYVTTTSGNTYGGDRRYIDVTYVIEAPVPYFMADKVQEVILHPSSVTPTIPMVSPPGWSNLNYGIYDTNGTIFSEEHSFSTRSTLYYTESGKEIVLPSNSVGNGFSFVTSGKFTLRALHTLNVRELAWFVDGQMMETISYSSMANEYKNINFDFETDNLMHEITIVCVSSFFYVFDCIYITPHTPLTVSISKKTTTSITVEPVVTKYRLSVLGKKIGDVTHPFTLKYRYLLTLPYNEDPSTWSEINNQSYYDNVYFINENEWIATESEEGRYACPLIEINLLALQSVLYQAGYTRSDIINNYINIMLNTYAVGTGCLDRQVEYGVRYYIWRPSTGTWIYETVQDASRHIKTTQDDSNNAYSWEEYMDANSIIRVALVSRYPAGLASSIIPSSVRLNYAYSEISINYVNLVNDFITNTAKNLVNNDNWVIYNGNPKVIGDTLQLISNNNTQQIYQIIDVKPNTSYYLKLHSTFRYIETPTLRVANANDGFDTASINTILSSSGISGAYERVFTTPENCRKISLLFSLVDETTYWIIDDIHLVQSAVPPEFYQTQEQYVVSLTDNISMGEDDKVIIDPVNDIYQKNQINIIGSIDDQSISNPFKLCEGINHLKINHSGGLLKTTLSYAEKYNTP